MAENISGGHTSRINLPVGIKIAAVLMIVFGLAEVATSFTHNFIEVFSTTETSLATALGVALGLFYFADGLMILTKRKWAAITAIVLLCGDVIGRIIMIMAGLYPLNSFAQSFAIVVGTVIATLFAIYIG
jgi:predicted transporter